MSAQLFVELLLEELPASMVRPALDSLKTGLLGLLEGIEHGAVRVWATPRRLAVAIDDVAEGRPVVEELLTGPPETSAFKNGEPTGAAKGFARGKGVDVADLEIVDGPKGRVIAARVKTGGERTETIVRDGLDAVVTGISFKKSMEWGRGGLRFARPLHRVNVVFAGDVLVGTAAGLETGNTTLGHRLASDTEFSFTSAEQWLEGLRARAVEPDLDTRKAKVRTICAELAAAQGADDAFDDNLVEEVTHLVECPTPILGRFDEELLSLPHKLLVTSMRAHQRYFPLFEDGKLTNRFVVVSNNPWGDRDLIAEGNARVLRARFYDARFFLAEDAKSGLASFTAELGKMRWIRGLGTVADKQARLAVLSGRIANVIGAEPDVAQSAGSLAKADLTSQMVGEFPELQGHMGRLYALAAGESPEVAAAIEEHYQPAFASDEAPASLEGAAVALADRLDTLVGCFGVGMQPKGGDPQGLRRAALGVVTILLAHGARVDLEELLALAIDTLRSNAEEQGSPAFDRWLEKAPPNEDLVPELAEFILTRWSASETAEGASGDLVDAVRASGGSDVVVLHGKVAAIKEVAGSAEWLGILSTFKRVLNISRDADVAEPSLSDLTHPAEEALFEAVQGVEGSVTDAVAQLDFERAIERILLLEAPVAAFFKAVMVDSDVPAERAVRLGLLRRIGRVFLQVADFSRISTR